MLPFEDYRYVLMVLLITMIKKCQIFIPWIMYLIIFIIIATTEKN